MDTRLRGIIHEAAKELNISKVEAEQIWTATSMIIRDIMKEGNPKDPDTYKRVFLRNIGTFHVKEKTIYALKQKFKPDENI
jgi:nucleoid DNA-binding protein